MFPENASYRFVGHVLSRTDVAGVIAIDGAPFEVSDISREIASASQCEKSTCSRSVDYFKLLVAYIHICIQTDSLGNTRNTYFHVTRCSLFSIFQQDLSEYFRKNAIGTRRSVAASSR